jgi:large subunit ribosomal protein L9
VKVVFLKDVPPSARAGDVKEVKDGYGRNFLLPRELAAVASAQALRRSEGLRKQAEVRRQHEVDEWRKLVSGMRGTPVTVLARAGQSGRLFGSVTTMMIAAQLSAATGKDIDRRGIRIPTPIRQVGSYTVGVKLFEGVETEVRVTVKPEGELVAEPPKEEKASASGGPETEPAESDAAEPKA